MKICTIPTKISHKYGQIAIGFFEGEGHGFMLGRIEAINIVKPLFIWLSRDGTKKGIVCGFPLPKCEHVFIPMEREIYIGEKCYWHITRRPYKPEDFK